MCTFSHAKISTEIFLLHEFLIRWFCYRHQNCILSWQYALTGSRPHWYWQTSRGFKTVLAWFDFGLGQTWLQLEDRTRSPNPTNKQHILSVLHTAQFHIQIIYKFSITHANDNLVLQISPIIFCYCYSSIGRFTANIQMMHRRDMYAKNVFASTRKR